MAQTPILEIQALCKLPHPTPTGSPDLSGNLPLSKAYFIQKVSDECLAIYSQNQDDQLCLGGAGRLVLFFPHRDSLSPSRMGGPALFSWLIGSGRGEVILGAPQGEDGEGAIITLSDPFCWAAGRTLPGPTHAESHLPTARRGSVGEQLRAFVPSNSQGQPSNKGCPPGPPVNGLCWLHPMSGVSEVSTGVPGGSGWGQELLLEHGTQGGKQSFGVCRSPPPSLGTAVSLALLNISPCMCKLGLRPSGGGTNATTREPPQPMQLA